MTLLVLTEEAKSDLKRLREYAESNPIPTNRLIRIAAGEEKPPGDDPRHTTTIPTADSPNTFKVVYSVEEHKGGWMRHISVSSRGGRPPTALALAAIARELGFRVSNELRFGQDTLAIPSPTWGWTVPNILQRCEEQRDQAEAK